MACWSAVKLVSFSGVLLPKAKCSHFATSSLSLLSSSTSFAEQQLLPIPLLWSYSKPFPRSLHSCYSFPDSNYNTYLRTLLFRTNTFAHFDLVRFLPILCSAVSLDPPPTQGLDCCSRNPSRPPCEPSSSAIRIPLAIADVLAFDFDLKTPVFIPPILNYTRTFAVHTKHSSPSPTDLNI